MYSLILCDGGLSPLGEFLSLVAFGLNLARTDGPAFLFEWTDDREEMSWDGNYRITMNGFRSLLGTAVERVSKRCEKLLYGWHPPHQELRKIRDRLPELFRNIIAMLQTPTKSGQPRKYATKAESARQDNTARRERRRLQKSYAAQLGRQFTLYAAPQTQNTTLCPTNCSGLM